MRPEVDTQGLERTILAFRVRPIPRPDDFLGVADDGRHPIAAGNLERDSCGTQTSMDSFHRRFLGGHRAAKATRRPTVALPKTGFGRSAQAWTAIGGPLRCSQRPACCQPRRESIVIESRRTSSKNLHLTNPFVTKAIHSFENNIPILHEKNKR